MKKTKPAQNPFEQVASEWREYRPNPSSELVFFLPLTPKGAVVLDAGCAHGRNHAKLLEKASVLYGIDLSPKLISYAKQNAKAKHLEEKTEFFTGSITDLPLPDSSIDCVYCLAVYHHLKSARERKKALKEFARVLKKGGRVFLSVWNRYQKRFEKLGAKNSAMVPWTTKQGKVVQRYYHFFQKEELQELADKCGFKVEKMFFEKGGRTHSKEGAANSCAVLRKI